jgi:hypothetical protein
MISIASVIRGSGSAPSNSAAARKYSAALSTLYAHRFGYENLVAHGPTGSPVDRRRNSPRCSRNSSPPRRALRVACVPPVATSYASSPPSVLSVEWNDDRVDPSIHSQFQPPSGWRYATSQSTTPSMSAPSQTPFATV